MGSIINFSLSLALHTIDNIISFPPRVMTIIEHYCVNKPVYALASMQYLPECVYLQLCIPYKLGKANRKSPAGTVCMHSEVICLCMRMVMLMVMRPVAVCTHTNYPPLWKWTKFSLGPNGRHYSNFTQPSALT